MYSFTTSWKAFHDPLQMVERSFAKNLLTTYDLDSPSWEELLDSVLHLDTNDCS